MLIITGSLFLFWKPQYKNLKIILFIHKKTYLETAVAMLFQFQQEAHQIIILITGTGIKS